MAQNGRRANLWAELNAYGVVRHVATGRRIGNAVKIEEMFAIYHTGTFVQGKAFHEMKFHYNQGLLPHKSTAGLCIRILNFARKGPAIQTSAAPRERVWGIVRTAHAVYPL